MPAKINDRYRTLFSQLMKKNMSKPSDKARPGMVAILCAWRNLDRELKAIELRHYAKAVRRLDATRSRHKQIVVLDTKHPVVISVAFVEAVNWQNPDTSYYGLGRPNKTHKKAKIYRPQFGGGN